MSQDHNCAMDEDSDTETNPTHNHHYKNHSLQPKRMSNCLATNSKQPPSPPPPTALQPIQYVDSMDCDSNSNKPRTLFSLLLDKRKRRKGSRNHKTCTNLSSDTTSPSSSSPTSYRDIQDKLTQEELRVIKDLKEISDSKWCARGTIVTIHLFQRLHNFKCTISPIEGPYRDGTFSFDVSVCKKYPFTAPQIKACHPMFHPNVHLHSLQVGLPVLRKSDWKPVLSLNDVLFSLQLMFMQPNIDALDQAHVQQTSSLAENKQSEMNADEAEHDEDGEDSAMSRQRQHQLRSNSACNRQRTRSRNQLAFGSNNHKPAYIPNITYSQSRSLSPSDAEAKDEHDAIVHNMQAALLFRDDPQQFERVCQQIIRGGVHMFGTNWQCIERKKMRNMLNRNINGEKYDPSLFGSQSFKVKAQMDRIDASTGTITKKCSVLRKRRRNESFEDDVFSMEKVKRALGTFASTTGSTKDGVYSDSGESQTSLINGVNGIQIQPPEKKRKIDRNGITEQDVGRISIVQSGDRYDGGVGIVNNGMRAEQLREIGFAI
eukprot:CAMPEP_0197036260 /NCGR_PEP_ID=MMETSP1384-20130603/13824_1 /TAXON_ID=29189 /ORGANISM="Ammonia sp." /LENGTH=542 /DNA_ID=CAMNT_0042466421 /DNA_START=29 /DNA_END=1654 /DNA_ORIENTATION=+